MHLSFSSSGGAGKVAAQLSQSQSTLGWNSSLLVGSDSDLRSEPFALPLHTLAASVDNYGLRRTKFPGLVSLARDRLSLLPDSVWEQNTILHLHWINGLVDLQRLPETARRRPIVWTLHDMNPFTGACHQAFACERFHRSCHECPAVRVFAQQSVELNLARKIRALATLENLTVVATSPWIAQQARSSSVFSESKIETIPNPLRPEFFETRSPPGRQSQPYLLVVASDTSDPLKNIDFVVQVFKALRETYPSLSLHLVGSHSRRFEGEGIHCFESLSAGELSTKMSGSVALLVPSLAETAPLVIAEATASGVPVVANDIPSLREMLEWVGSGVVARGLEEWTEVVSALVASTLENSPSEQDRNTRRQKAQIFEPMFVAKQYLDLYERIS